ncbi:DUF3653 domain-containing protein [Shewanella maritima]|uniref:DUF3653 domain-containing protein n=1 Tax=Shewanella maritima TaxID=2520507 RepID=UPI003735CBFA
MKKQSKDIHPKGFENMTPATREFFLFTFKKSEHSHHTLDKDKAAAFFCVTPRTITNWWRTGCPAWVDNYIKLYKRSIPNTKEWQDFRFSHDGKELLTPFKRHSFTANQLLGLFYETQFHRMDKSENKKLRLQVDSLRSEEETEALKGELDFLIQSIKKLKDSPILAHKGKYSKSVKQP